MIAPLLEGVHSCSYVLTRGVVKDTTNSLFNRSGLGSTQWRQRRRRDCSPPRGSSLLFIRPDSGCGKGYDDTAVIASLLVHTFWTRGVVKVIAPLLEGNLIITLLT